MILSWIVINLVTPNSPLSLVSNFNPKGWFKINSSNFQVSHLPAFNWLVSNTWTLQVNLVSYLNVHFCNWFILEILLGMALLKNNFWVNYCKVMFMVGDCNAQNIFKITVTALHGPGVSSLEAVLFPASQDCFLSPGQVCFFIPLSCEDQIALFTETSLLKDYTIFWDKSVHHLYFWTFVYDFCDTSILFSVFPHYNFNLFLKICPKCHYETCFLSHSSLLWHFCTN